MALIRISGPSVEPVTLSDAKAHLRIDFDDEDALITSYITAARKKLERRCGRAFISQEWEYRTIFPCADEPDEIVLPYPPTIELTTFTYIDEDGDTQTLVEDTDFIFIDGGESPSSVISIDGWPTDPYDRADAVRLRFTTGYAAEDESPVDDTSGVPQEIKQAILWLVGHFAENRESVLLTPTRQELQEVPDTVAAIIAPYIVPRL